MISQVFEQGKICSKPGVYFYWDVKDSYLC